jgi:hypothetical protein
VRSYVPWILVAAAALLALTSWWFVAKTASDTPTATTDAARPDALDASLDSERAEIEVLRGEASPEQDDERETGDPDAWSIAGELDVSGEAPLHGAEVAIWAGRATDQAFSLASLMDLGANVRRSQDIDPFLETEGDPLARAPVRSDGSFEITVSGHDHVRLDLLDRFHGLTSPLPVHAPTRSDDAASRVDLGKLETYAGGYVIGRLLGAGETGPGGEVRIGGEPDPMSVLTDPTGFFATYARALERAAPIDADGRFEFRAVPPNPRVRLLWRDGTKIAAPREFAVGAGESVEVALVAQEAARLELRVVDTEGRPVANARIAVEPIEVLGALDRLLQGLREQTDENGRCVFEGLLEGEQIVAVEAPGFLPRQSEIRTRAAESVTEEIVLERGLAIRGRVVDADRQPIEGAGVAFLATQRVPLIGDISQVAGADNLGILAEKSPTRTAADGTFDLTGVPADAELTVIATHPDYATGLANGVRSGTDESVEIVLRRPTVLVGTVVVDSDPPEPVESFSVRVQETVLMLLDRSVAVQRFETDDGRFELRGLRPGRFTLAVESERHGRTEQSITLEPGATLDVGRIALPPAASVAGRVLAPDGTPVANAWVFERKGGLLDDPTVARFFDATRPVRSGRDGSFELRGLSGGRSVTLRAAVEGYASGQSERLELFPGRTLHGVEIHLGVGGAIEGQLHVPPGDRPEEWQIIASRKPFGGTAITHPDGYGAFRFPALDPGPWDLQALNTFALQRLQQEAARATPTGQIPDISSMITSFAEMSVTERVGIVEGETVTVDLDASDLDVLGSRAVTLRARVTVGGSPLSSAFVEIRGADGGMRVGVVEDGDLLATGLLPGFNELFLRRGTTLSAVGDPIALDVPESAVGGTWRTQIDLPAGVVAGRVVDEAGSPLRGVFVRLQHADETQRAETECAFTVTDIEGSFRFEGVTRGDYTLLADSTLSAGEAAGSLQKLRVGDGETRDGLTLVAGRGAALVVHVRAGDASPLPHAFVAVCNENGEPLTVLPFTRTDASGEARITGLPDADGVYLVAWAEGHAPTVDGPFDLRAGLGLAERELTLVRGTPVEVQVIDIDGTDLSDRGVRVRLNDGPWLPRFVLPQSPGGPTVDCGPLPPGDVDFAFGDPQRPFRTRRSVPDAGRARFVLTP